MSIIFNDDDRMLATVCSRSEIGAPPPICGKHKIGWREMEARRYELAKIAYDKLLIPGCDGNDYKKIAKEAVIAADQLLEELGE